MAQRILKKVILIILVAPLLTAHIVARILADFFSELEDWTDSMFTKVGRWLAEKLDIME